MPARDFPHASLLEGIRFTAQVAVPNVAQGLFRRRRTIAAVAGHTHADSLAIGFMEGLKRSYGEGPVWIRVGASEALLVLGRGPIRHVLEGSPDPFAADPEPKKSSMERFQPDALTISRGTEWEERRRFTDHVLDAGMSSLAERFATVCAEEAAQLPYSLDWDGWNRAVRRVARRVILGDEAADDDRLSEMLGELMDKANPPGQGDASLLARFSEALGRYVDAAAPEALVGLFATAPVGARTKPERQVTHWLFALGDTLAINAFRCLAVVAGGVSGVPGGDDSGGGASGGGASGGGAAGGAADAIPELEAALHEAMRLWPTTSMLSRVTVRDSDWDGVRVPAGTQVLIVNLFNHRDRSVVSFADRFAPEAWLPGGSAVDDWQFNHFSHGPQGCPGTALAMLVGRVMLDTLVRDREVRLVSPDLDATRPLPRSLDYFGLRFELGPRSASAAAS